MRTELIEVSPVHREIRIEIDPTEIQPAYNKVVQQYQKMANIPGFRRGNAPIAVVRNRFKEDIQSETLRELLPNRVTEAIQEYNLNPLSEPQLHLDNAENLNLTGNQPLTLHVHVETMPTVEAFDYQGLEATRRVRPVVEEEVEQIIEQKRREGAALEPVEDRAAEVGDTVNIDVRGTIQNQSDAEPIAVEDLEIELGGAGVEQTFTENLIGVSPDDVRTFTINYPEDFNSPALAGQAVEYTATVKSVGHVVLPELDDEWARSLDEGYETLADFRNKVKQDLELYAKMEADNRVRDELVNKLIDANPVEVPPTLVNYQAQGLTRTFADEMGRRGLDLRQADQKFWQMAFQRFLPQAEREVRGALLLDKIAEIENFEISSDEIAAEIENAARYSGRPIDEVRAELTQDGGENNIIERLRNRRAIETVVEAANITDGEWIEESEELEEAPIVELNEAAAEATDESGEPADENATAAEGQA